MPIKMKRMQIYIEPELDEELGRVSARRRVSKAQLLREGAWRVIREEMAGEENALLAIVGLAHGEPGKTSEEHDNPAPEHEGTQARP
ncbi:MAG: ribbon-helix-helix domain-containing protein [Chloroflexi bacterium]|nr:ribbon-helix-helix domain-containing protein [Chloroflexota bacterium]